MSSPSENQAIRVLLVDDDPVVLKVYEKELSNRGFKIERAMDGIEALRALRNRAYKMAVECTMTGTGARWRWVC